MTTNSMPVPPESPPLSLDQFKALQARWRLTEIQLEGPRVLVSGIELEDLWRIIQCAEWAVKQAESKSMAAEWKGFINLASALQNIVLEDDPKAMKVLALNALTTVE